MRRLFTLFSPEAFGIRSSNKLPHFQHHRFLSTVAPNIVNQTKMNHLPNVLKLAGAPEFPFAGYRHDQYLNLKKTFDRGYGLYQKKNVAEALKIFNRLIESKNDISNEDMSATMRNIFSRVFTYKADILWRAGTMEEGNEAISSLKKALKLNSKNGKAKQLLSDFECECTPMYPVPTRCDL